MNKNNDNGRWDRVFESLGRLEVTCEEIKKDLEYHIYRTDLLEEKFEPVEDHVKFVKKAAASLFAVALACIGYFIG